MTDLVSVGDVLAGKYRVEKVLGVGGMGMVVAAMHLELEERVALKFMLPEAMRSPQAVERFLREAKASVKLRSEHVCRVFDVGKLENGAPYIVMEFMEGKDFGDVISQRGTLSVSDAVDFLLQAIEGVAEAHANRIVHRDLKPANLFVVTDSDGSPLVKVLDFGISKSSVAAAATKTGDMMGSPLYMAPEQMRSSKDVDRRADVWALGVILYQAVTGRLPFDGETLVELCVSVIHDEPPPLTAVRQDLPPAFSDVVMGCLHKQIDQRVPDVGALAKGLAPFGGPDAAARAMRVAKMLNRANMALTPPLGNLALVPPSSTTAQKPAVFNPVDTKPADSFRSISTLQSSAGSLDVSQSPAPRRGRFLVGGIGAALLAGVVLFVVARQSGHSDPGVSAKQVAPTSAPQSQPAPPPPTPAPTQVPLNAPTASAPAAPVAIPPAPVVTSPMSAEAIAAPAKQRDKALRTRPRATSGMTSTQTPATKPSTKPTTPSVSCDPPYVVSATGKRTYKPECL